MKFVNVLLCVSFVGAFSMRQHEQKAVNTKNETKQNVSKEKSEPKVIEKAS